MGAWALKAPMVGSPLNKQVRNLAQNKRVSAPPFKKSHAPPLA